MALVREFRLYQEMIWAKRILLVLPFGTAGVLTVLSLARPLHERHKLEVCGFLFGAPWAWLLDRGWFGAISSKRLGMVVGYLILLWVPALLYSCCLWLCFRALHILRLRSAQFQGGRHL